MTKERGLDETDRAMLYYLLMDVRAKDSALAKKLKISKQVVNYRIQKLIKQGFIMYSRVSVNYFRLGKKRYSLLFDIAPGQNSREVINYLRLLPNICVVIDCIGNWSHYVALWVDDVEVLDEQLHELFSKITIAKYCILQTVYSATMFGRIIGRDIYEDLYDDKKARSAQVLEIDAVDKKLITCLNEDSRIPLVQLAQKLGVSVHMLKYRFQKLTETGVIQRCFAVLNMAKLGYQEFACLCKLDLSKTEMLENFVKSVRTQKEISYYMRCIGEWDFYFSAFVHEPSDFRAIIEKMMTDYKGLITSYDTFITHLIR